VHGRVGEHELDDLAGDDGRGRRTAPLDLGAQGAQVLRPDLGHAPVLEDRTDAPVDDRLAHGLGAVGHPVLGEPALGVLAEGLRIGQPAFLALLFLGGRDALGASTAMKVTGYYAACFPQKRTHGPPTWRKPSATWRR
jgi:hypothetical protein